MGSFKSLNRENLYLGRVYNTSENIAERKILCRYDGFSIEDVLFDSPSYRTDTPLNNYIVYNLVSLNALLKRLEYGERLNIKDVKKIYYCILRNTKTLYENCDLFGTKRYDRGYKGLYVYLIDYWNMHSIQSFEEFEQLEKTIYLPINPTAREKESSSKTFKKKMFFIS